MNQKEYIVEGRQFRTQSDYARALHDKKIITELREKVNFKDKAALQKLLKDLKEDRYDFLTMLKEDFYEEVEDALKHSEAAGRKSGKRNGRVQAEQPKLAGELKGFVEEELKKREKRRRRLIALCGVVAAGCLGYFGIYSWFQHRTAQSYQELSELKNRPSASSGAVASEPLFTLDREPEEKEVLEEYKNLLNKNKKLIGWVKIDDKDINIDYPVMQTDDNTYYLDHNMEQEYDKNGSIFMDKDCDVLKPSTNLIIYGHHMQSGKMFGKLGLYEDEEYYRENPYIQFDTIYEKGVYQVMYVFRSRVYSEAEIVFKYYQFIDANSEQEFDSYMKEMAEMSFYDTGVTAKYGDRLLTLSTCDYQEKNGRFVVVAKKIKE